MPSFNQKRFRNEITREWAEGFRHSVLEFIPRMINLDMLIFDQLLALLELYRARNLTFLRTHIWSLNESIKLRNECYRLVNKYIQKMVERGDHDRLRITPQERREGGIAYDVFATGPHTFFVPMLDVDTVGKNQIAGLCREFMSRTWLKVRYQNVANFLDTYI